MKEILEQILEEQRKTNQLLQQMREDTMAQVNRVSSGAGQAEQLMQQTMGMLNRLNGGSVNG
jgi:DNA-binding protein H-NS